MKTFFLSLTCILMLSGCAQKHHLRYNPDLESRRLEPINLNVEIKIDSILLKGFKTDVSLWENIFEDTYYFPELKEDIQKAIIEDLRYDLFPLEGDPAEISVNVKTRFDFKTDRHDNNFLVVTGGVLFGCLIGGYLHPTPEGQPPDISIYKSMAIGASIGGTVGVIIYSILDKDLGDAWLSCEILDRNEVLIASYEAKSEKRKKGEQKVLQATLNEALSDIKSQIDRDREKILEAVME